MQILAQSKSRPFQLRRTRVLAPDDESDSTPIQVADLATLEESLKRASPHEKHLISAVLQEDSPDITPAVDNKELQKAIAAVVGKNVSGLGVAAGSWKLSSLAATSTEGEMVNALLANNVSPLKAPGYAKEIMQLLNNPAVRTLLVGISAGALTYTVVEKTSWSNTTKWWTTIVVSVVAAGLFWLLRQMGIAA